MTLYPTAFRRVSAHRYRIIAGLAAIFLGLLCIDVGMRLDDVGSSRSVFTPPPIEQIIGRPVSAQAEPAVSQSLTPAEEPAQASSEAPPVEVDITTASAAEQPVEQSAPSQQAPVVASAPASAPIAVSNPLPVSPETWDATTRGNVQAAIALLPDSVRRQLGNPALGPVLIEVNREGRTLGGNQPYGGTANFFSTSEGVNQVVLYPQQSVFTILHELGHSYNMRRLPAGAYGQVYSDPEMHSFLQAAGWRLLTPPAELAGIRDQAKVSVVRESAPIWAQLSRDDPLEDFANSFAMYFSDPSQLAKVSPGRYAWFSGTFGAR